jgi:hypothetical protein
MRIDAANNSPATSRNLGIATGWAEICFLLLFGNPLNTEFLNNDILPPSPKSFLVCITQSGGKNRQEKCKCLEGLRRGEVLPRVYRQYRLPQSPVGHLGSLINFFFWEPLRPKYDFRTSGASRLVTKLLGKISIR